MKTSKRAARLAVFVAPMLLCLAGVCLAAGAAAARPGSAPNPLDRIKIWEGRWQVQVRINETPYSHAGSVTYDADCAWLPNRGYMVCDYLSTTVDPSQGKIVNNLSIFAYSEVDKAYKHFGFGTEGDPHVQVTSIQGNVWTTPFEIVTGKGEKLQCRNVYEFLSAEKQISRFEVSADEGQHWTVLREGVGTKTR